MTQRSGDWHLFGYDSDPVPATHWDVQAIRDEMRERSNDASTMRSTLERLASLDGWRGEAATAFADKADEVLEDLGKVVDRYDKAADALSTWADDVDVARDATWRALQDAEAADEMIRNNPPFYGTGEAPDGQETSDTRRENAEGDLEAARTDLRNAMDAFEEAAERAKDRIEDAADIWDDGWWGDFKGWVRDNADFIATIVKVLEIVGFVLGAIILVLALTIGAPFALIAAAVVVGLLVVAGKAMQAAADTGKADWGDVAWAVVGVAATVAGGGLGKLAAKGLTSLKSAMSLRLTNQAMSNAFARLSGGNLQSVVSALSIRNPNNPLFKWAQGVASGVDDAGRAVTQTFDDIANIKPSALKTILMQDRGLAQLQAQLSRLQTLGPTSFELLQMGRIQANILGSIGANTVGLGVFGKDAFGLPDTISDLGDLFSNPPWSTQPVN